MRWTNHGPCPSAFDGLHPLRDPGLFARVDLLPLSNQGDESETVGDTIADLDEEIRL